MVEFQFAGQLACDPGSYCFGLCLKPGKNLHIPVMQDEFFSSKEDEFLCSSQVFN